MIDENTVREVNEVLTKEFPEAKVPLQIRPVPKPESRLSLSEQWDVIARHDRELREKVRKERVDIIAEHDTKWTNIHTTYARELSEMKATLDAKKEQMMRALEAETHDRLRANEFLAQRLNRS